MRPVSAALDYQEGSLRATATLTIENVSERATHEVPFILGRLMRVEGVTGADGRSLDLDQDVVSFSDWPTYQVNHCVARLPAALAPGARTTVTVTYSGWVVPYTETGMLYVRDRIDEDFTILRAESYPFPVIGVPSWEADRSAPHLDFEYRVAISVPERLTVANGGRLLQRTVRDGVATWVYESTAPAPFLLLPIAEYTIAEERGVRVYSFPEHRDGGTLVLDRALRALELLESWFGEVSGPAGLAGGIIQTAAAFERPEHLFELYHELSHLWNAPDSERPSPRWNEGLAVFLQYRLAEILDGWEGMDAAITNRADRLSRTMRENPSYRDIPFPDYGRRRMTDLSYSSGFLMFYLLDRLMGTEALLAGLRHHYQRHRATSGSFEDLAGALDEASPMRLDPFLRPRASN